MTLKGQSAIVTGGARGIGRACAVALAEEGVNVLVADLNAEGAAAIARQVDDLGGRGVSFAADVTNEAQVQAMVERAVSEFGGLDILVNTAAWLDPPIPVVDMPFDEVWRRALTTDLDSVFLCCKHALKVMIPAKKGRIVSLSSGAGKRGRALRASYGAAKAAIINLTESIALEAAPHGITVNCICPGAVIGNRAENIFMDLAERGGKTREEGLQEYEKLKERFVSEEEVADLAMYLISERGARISGQAISIA
ncbi:MAG TPA: SDR family NAD(P)-dependent oxidoreductase [Dehalococcoidia bacterium]|nr:SDR family NAD(P)-dependent oxidoreductase [Dehalococcoidia bacterium]